MTALVTSFSLVRHAKTAWNLERRIQGQTDTHLAPEGLAQAEAYVPVLLAQGFDAVLSSDLLRARQTVAPFLARSGLPQTLDPRLREAVFGEWEGRAVAELRASGDIARLEPLGWDFAAPGGESRRQLAARALSALADAARARPGGRILVATHEGVLKAVLYHLLGRAYLPSEPQVLLPYHMHRIAFDGRGWRVDRLNIPLIPEESCA